MKLTIFAFILVSSFAFGSELSQSQLADLKQNWLLNEPKSYRYTLVHGAGPFGYTIVKVVIRKGKCKARSQYVFGKRYPWERSSCKGNKIHELIASVQEQELKGVFSSKILINEKYGFISKYSAEPKTDATDQDWHFEVSSFKVN